MNVYDFEAVRIDGGTEPLGNHRGQVLLIVNTAAQPGIPPLARAAG
jgi:glutathione peroxidase